MRMFHKGEKGFTLIELLVVIAILGILAAIIIPAVANFIGSGTESAANTEAHNVELAVTAFMAENCLSDFDGEISPTSATGAEEFISHYGRLQAIYTIVDGKISSAVPITGSKWGDLVYTPDNGWS